MTILRQSYCFSGNIAFYFFFLLSLVLHTLASPMLHYCRHDHRDALLEFKHEFPTNELESRSLSSWIKSNDCCSWEGVTCDDKSGEVISLDLSFIPFNNSLKPYSGIFKLHHLRNLTLRECHLYGETLSSLGNLSHLTHLDLKGNYLVGEVPASVGYLTKLRYLDLSKNKFTKNIPFSFANLTNLSYLDISLNHFKGENFPLPFDMNQFHNLEYFDVGGNSFSGTFPTSLFMIPSLTWVSLWGNQFKGPIEFKNTSSSSRLQTLSLYQNKLEGPIPKSISKFSNLERLFLSHNNFTGPVLRSISNLVKLVTLDLSDNSFTGPIPISNLDNLLTLDLSGNKLEGEIPGWFGRVSELRLSHNSFSSLEKSFQVSDLTQTVLLDLSSNSFRGPLPHWICNLTSILLLDLSDNSFSGSIPQCLRNTIVSLTTLRLQNNNLSGILPPDLFANATTWLESVDVSSNQLEGKLPKSLINCTQLKLLNVESNKIKDKFPSWLSSLPSLHVMILRSNQFYGPLYHHDVSIGFQSLKIIDISDNDFNGTLPPFYFSNWRAMTELTEEDSGLYMADFYLNLMSMELVGKGMNMKFERIITTLRAIDFSRNKFCGKIPNSVGLLKELSLVNFSGNTFTGNIPQSLADLIRLESLDLSGNQLSGQIPRDLGNLSFLTFMNFSHNNLEGPIPQGVQVQMQPCSVFMNNPKLYGLEYVCEETHHVSNPTPQESEDLSEPKEEVISWIAAAIAYVPGVFCGLVIGHIFSSHKHNWLM